MCFLSSLVLSIPEDLGMEHAQKSEFFLFREASNNTTHPKKNQANFFQWSVVILFVPQNGFIDDRLC